MQPTDRSASGATLGFASGFGAFTFGAFTFGARGSPLWRTSGRGGGPAICPASPAAKVP